MNYYPDRTTFLKLARKGKVIPVYQEIMADYETPVSAFAKIKSGDCAFLLESVEGGERIARYSFLGANPSLVFSSKGRQIEIRQGNISKRFETKTDPIDELRSLLKRYKPVKIQGLPRFSGGLVGYFGYDIVRFVESLPDKNPDDLKLPDAVFMLTDTLLIFDHVDHKIKVVSNVLIDDDPDRSYDEAVNKIESLVKRMKQPSAARNILPLAVKKARSQKVMSNMDQRSFVRSVQKAKEYIKSGDIIQVVLSQRFAVPVKSDPFEVYRALRSINPSPYMYYLEFPDFQLIGASPEIMVRCEEKIVELRPIAGTRPRGATDKEDARLARELLQDPKERAEHVMLVDLGRNDVGKVCGYRTVRVSELMTIEKYSHVMHIVSDVSGTLRKNKDVFDVVRAAFPAGTVTGAPKVRAMEIIDELEKVRRGPYAGSVGYFSFSGNLDSCITIRTIVVKDRMAYIQAGAGIVAYSRPEKEYQETLNKAKALLKAIEFAEEGFE